MKIGIPRAMLYYFYKDLWLNFFKNLGVETVLSPPSNKEIVKKGIANSIDEGCYSSKVFVGHVEYLLDKCDMIFVPRIENCALREEYCTKVFGLYDLIRNTFPHAKLLNANVNYIFLKREKNAFMDIGDKLGFTPEQTEKAYIDANTTAVQLKEAAVEKQDELLKSDKLKVLIVSHSYNTHDAAIGLDVVKYFEKNDIVVIHADVINEKKAFAKSREIYRRMYWKVSGTLLGGIETYKDAVDGIVLISTFPCMPDSIMNELIVRTVKDKPILSLMIDELDATAGLVTRLESFTDILNARRKRDGRKNCSAS